MTDPFEQDLEGFLAAGLELDVDPIFGKPLEVLLSDYDIEPEDGAWPSHSVKGVTIAAVRSGIVAMSGPDIVGGYLGCDLAIHPDWRGRGLGAEVVLARCLWSGINPATQLDVAAYSPAGYATHARAWQLGQENEIKKRFDFSLTL